MTLASVKKNTYILLFIMMVTAFLYWKLLMANFIGDEIANGVGIPSLLSPFLVFLLYKLKYKKGMWPKPIAFGMAVSLGIFVGSFSGFLERGTPGVVAQAIVSTFITAFSVIFLYKNKYITVNNKFMHFTIFIVNTILWIVFVDFIMSIIDLNWSSFFSGTNNKSILLSSLVMILGYLVFTIDLNIIDQKLQINKSDKEEAWAFATELLIDFVWIYLCIIFFIARFRERKS